MDQTARHERVPAGHPQLPHREPVDAGPDAATPPPSRHPRLPAWPGRRPPPTHRGLPHPGTLNPDADAGLTERNADAGLTFLRHSGITI
jgi:hypothetical protein